MIISLLLSLIAIASGALLTYTYEDDAPLVSRLCSGACIGFGLMGLIGFVIASFLGLTMVTLCLTASFLATSFLLLVSNQRRKQLGDEFNRVIKAINRASHRPDRWAFIYFFFYAAVAIGMWMVFERALLDKPDGIATGVLNNYGDLPFHISVITRFAFGQNFPPEDPTFAGVRFTYPFLTDFISAMFVRAGANLRDSLFIENYIVGVALVGVLHRFGQQLVRNRTAAILTPVLIILNGGFGWAMLYDDVNKSDGGVFQVLRHIPHSYTILPDIAQGWRWGNAVTSLLVPQRGFLLGIPLVAIVFTQWWTAMNGAKGKAERAKGKGSSAKSEQKNGGGNSPDKDNSLLIVLSSLPSRRMLAAGVIAGMLPLIHAHSFIAVMMVAAFLVPWIYRRGWIAYGVTALVGLFLYWSAVHLDLITASRAKIVICALAIGLSAGLFFLLPMKHLRLWIYFFVLAIGIGGPQIAWSTHGSAVKMGSFAAWKFGWDSDQDTTLGPKAVEPQPLTTPPPLKASACRALYVAWFWLKNTGAFMPLLIAALLWKREDYLVPRKLLIFYLPFTLCFIVPNVFKLAPWIWDNIKILFYWWLASAPIVALLLARWWESGAWRRGVAASLLIILTLAGGIDVFALATRQGDYEEFDREGVNFAEMIKERTPPTATILHAPIHNTPIFLTGRRSLMGYPGHIWTHGLDYGPREAEIKRIYAGAPDAESLMSKYRVDYVVIDPQERSLMKVNEDFFKSYPEVASTGDYHLYKIAR